MEWSTLSPLAILGGLGLFALAATLDDRREARATRARIAEFDAMDAAAEPERERLRRMFLEAERAEWQREATEQRRAARRARTDARRKLRPGRADR